MTTTSIKRQQYGCYILTYNDLQFLWSSLEQARPVTEQFDHKIRIARQLRV